LRKGVGGEKLGGQYLAPIGSHCPARSPPDDERKMLKPPIFGILELDHAHIPRLDMSFLAHFACRRDHGILGAADAASRQHPCFGLNVTMSHKEHAVVIVMDDDRASDRSNAGPQPSSSKEIRCHL
jgi:hypothetical protein